MIIEMKGIWAVPVIVSILILGAFVIQEATAGIQPQPFLANQLKAVLNVLSAQSDRLDKINAAGAAPPDDGIPAALAALDSITSQCTGISDTANEMKGDFSRGGGGDSTEPFSLFSAIPSVQYAFAATPPDDNLTNRLQSIANVLSNTNSRLDKINAAGVQPPDDNAPIIAALDGIIGECSHIIDTARIMIGDLSRPGGGQ